MARKLKKAIAFETDLTVFDSGKQRPVVVMLRPPGVIELRLKGCRRTHALTADGLYWGAARAEARNR